MSPEKAGGVAMTEPDIKHLFERFHAAYHELREAWLKTGGGMELDLTIRDAAAEANFQRRVAAAQKGAITRRRRHG